MVNNPPAKARDVEDMGSDSGSGKSPGEGLGSTSVFLPGKFHGQRRWWATGHRVTKSRTKLSTHEHYSQPKKTDTDFGTMKQVSTL